MNRATQSELETLHGAFKALCIDLDFPQWYACYLHRRAMNEGIYVYTRMLPLISQVTVKGLEDGFATFPTHFEYMRNGVIPHFMGATLLKVFHKDGTLRGDVCSNAVRRIRQFCEYAYKADFDYSPDLVNGVIQRFVDNESNIADEIDDNPISELARSLCEKLFSDYNGDIVPKHGPGVTSNVHIKDKYEYRMSPDLPVYGKFARLFFVNERDGIDSLHRYPVRNSVSYFNKGKVESRVILVPKDSRGPRLISCEPVENQYIQQGLLAYMVRCMEDHPLTAGHVNFTDQTINREFAKGSSIDREWSTLDLKDASDMNSLTLFRLIFGSSLLGEDLLLARTPSTRLPDGRLIDMKKFAPMGSAVCFPVMACTIFLLIVSALTIGGLPLVDARDSVFVYGDDIIVRTKYVKLAVSVLQHFGFVVNNDKSFSKGHFRESCGADFYKGANVAPTRLRKIRKSGCVGNNERKGLAALNVKHANELSKNLLFHTAEYWYTRSEKYLGKLPYGTEDSAYLCRLAASTDEASLYSDAKLLDGYQRVTAWVIRPLEDETDASGWGHLMKVLRLMGKNLIPPRYGTYVPPRKWKLIKKRNLIVS